MTLENETRETFTFTVDKVSRLDNFIADATPELTRSRCAILLKNGCIKVNGQVITKKSFKVQIGQEVTLIIPDPVSISTPAEDLGVSVIFEDQDLLILKKPSGVLTHPIHPGQGGSMVSAALFICSQLSGINGKLRPGVVHRLDRETSGILVMAKNDYAHNKLQRDFHDRRVKKTYFAITYGASSDRAGSIELPLGRHPRKRTLRTVDHQGKDALTRYRIIKSWGKFHLVHLQPHTGRTHQLRVHLKNIGMPIVHDRDYQGRSLGQWVNRVQLHHHNIRLDHPRTGESMLFRCPLLPDMLKLISRLEAGETYSWPR